MKPYFGTHAVGLLLLLVVLVWGAMELSQYSQGLEARKGATRVGKPSWRLATWACLIAANVVLYLAPHIVPAAAIRPGAVAFTAGMVVLLAGVALRGWSFKTLAPDPRRRPLRSGLRHARRLPDHGPARGTGTRR